MFHECQAVTVVVHVVQFSPFSWHRHVSHLRRGRWLAVSGFWCAGVAFRCGLKQITTSSSTYSTWAEIDMGRDQHGPKSTWAEVDGPRSTWAEIDEYHIHDFVTYITKLYQGNERKQLALQLLLLLLLLPLYVQGSVSRCIVALWRHSAGTIAETQPCTTQLGLVMTPKYNPN